MAKIQNFKRIIGEDYPEKDRSLISKLAYSINVFAEDVTNAFNKNLSINDNLNLSTKEINVTVNSSGVPVATLKMNSGLGSVCKGMIVINSVNKTNTNNTPSGTPFITFADNSGLITINKVTNLTANDNYTLTLVLFP